MRSIHAPESEGSRRDSGPGQPLATFARTVRHEVRALDASPRALRHFGRVVGGVLLALGALVLWRKGWALTLAPALLLAAGVALVGLGQLAPAWIRPVHRAWMTAALALGFVMTRVLLTLFFLFVITPAGWLRRTFGKSPVLTRPDPDAETYWIRHAPFDGDPKERLERLY